MDTTDIQKEVLIPNVVPRLPISMANLTMTSISIGTIGALTLTQIGGGALTLLGLYGLSFFVTTFGISLGAYALGEISGKIDRFQLKKTEKIDFLGDISLGLPELRTDLVPEEDREKEAKDLVRLINENYVPYNLSTQQAARLTGNAVQEYIKERTGQRINFYHGVRKGLKLVGILSGEEAHTEESSKDITVYREEGMLFPFDIGHEQSHRLNYSNELEAQLLTYYAFMNSQNPLLVQSARIERLMGDLVAIGTKREKGIVNLAEKFGLRTDVTEYLRKETEHQKRGVARTIQGFNLRENDKILKAGGQNGASDFLIGFTNYLYLKKSMI